jgi:hypothetical protein
MATKKATPTPIANREAGQVVSGRVSRRRVPSEEVQGEGTWVEVVALKYGESKRIQRQLAGLTAGAKGEEQKAKLSEQMIIDHVVAWNWKDDDGNALALPKEKPDVLEELTADEMVFLANCLKPDASRGKSLPPS